MNETLAVPMARMLSWILWTLVCALELAAWAVWSIDADDGPWVLLATSGCAASAAAAVAHIRSYFDGTCRLIRVAHGLPTETDLHSV